MCFNIFMQGEFLQCQDSTFSLFWIDMKKNKLWALKYSVSCEDTPFKQVVTKHQNLRWQPPQKSKRLWLSVQPTSWCKLPAFTAHCVREREKIKHSISQHKVWVGVEMAGMGSQNFIGDGRLPTVGWEMKHLHET